MPGLASRHRYADLIGLPTLVMTGRPYRCDPTGATDCTAAVNAAHAAVYAAGGGTIYWPRGSYRIDGQVILPNDGQNSNPKQPPIRWTGDGAHASGTNNMAPFGGTQLDLRYAGEGVSKILTKGIGNFEIDRLTLKDDSTGGAKNSKPFVRTTNTSLRIHHAAIVGNPEKSAQQCDQDAIIFGGNTTDYGTLGDEAPFQGYGTVIDSCYFNRIRSLVGQVYANGIQIVNNTFWAQCGGVAPIRFTAPLSTNCGNYVAGNLIEMYGYVYGIELIGQCNGNALIGNDFWDAHEGTAVAFYHFGPDAYRNLVIDGFHEGNVIAPENTLHDESWGNTFISANQANVSRFTEPVDFHNEVIRATKGYGLRLAKDGHVWSDAIKVLTGPNYYRTWNFTPSGGNAVDMFGMQYDGSAHMFKLYGTVGNYIDAFGAPLRLRSSEVWLGSSSVQKWYWLGGLAVCQSGGSLRIDGTHQLNSGDIGAANMANSHIALYVDASNQLICRYKDAEGADKTLTIGTLA